MIASFGPFDLNLYVIANPDASKAGSDAIFHLRVHGWRDGRRPDPLFPSH